MNNLKLNKTVATLLAQLQTQDLAQGRFRSALARHWLQKLEDEHIIYLYKKGKTFYIRLQNADALTALLKSLGINDLQEFIQVQNKNITRSISAKLTSDSKKLSGRILQGFFIRSIKPTQVSLNGTTFDLSLFSDSWLFIVKPQTLHIPPNIPIIGIENYETFARIEHYPHFSKYTAIYIWQFSGNQIINWLQKIPNPYIHFGDFDLSGLAIYITRYKRKLSDKKVSFYIPPNLDELFLLYGNNNLYFRQLNDPRVKSIDFNQHSEIIPVFRLIQKYHKGVEQETLEKKK